MLSERSEGGVEHLVIFKDSQPEQKRAVCSDHKLRKIVFHIQRNQNAGFSRAGRSIGCEHRLCLSREAFRASGFHREYLSDDHTLCAI